MYSVLIRSLDIMTHQIAIESIEASDYAIFLDTGKTSLFGIDKIRRCYEIGYEETKKQMIQLKTKLGYELNV